MAEKPIPESPTAVAVTRHLKMSNRQPLSAYTYFDYSGRLPHVEAIFACTYDWKDCHRLSRRKGSDSRRWEKQRRELEGSAVPAIETGQTLNHFGLGTSLLGIGKDMLKSGLGLLEGRKDLATEERDEGSRQRRGGLPAFTPGTLLLDGEDHLVVAKKLKSLTDRAFTHPEPPLDMVEIEGAGGYVEQGVDFGDRARDTQNAGHPHEEISELDFVGLKGLKRRAAFTASG